MCIICKEWEAGRLTNQEAMRAAGEVLLDADNAKTNHVVDLVDKILEKEMPQSQQIITESLDTLENADEDGESWWNEFYSKWATENSIDEE